MRFRLAGLLNAVAIVAIGAWGCVTKEWYFAPLGGKPNALEIVQWLLIALNAPAFLISVAALSFAHLGLFAEFVIGHALWAVLSLVVWSFYPRLLAPSFGASRAIMTVTGVAASGAAVWILTVAWQQIHDPMHSCWDGLQAVFMLAGLAGAAFVFASKRG